MDEQLKSNLTSGKHWLRFLYMVFFAVCLQVAGFVMWVLVGLQFLFALITGSDNLNLRRFGKALSEYILQALQFLTYNTDEKPFPFAEWPKVEIPDEPPLEGEVEVADHESAVTDEVQAEEVEVEETQGATEKSVDESEPGVEENLEVEPEKP
eukprot:TRINITY_DN110324_c0_g1_i1.p1 TRINITY_DN110324_c0_g1~~TRINITY_DN110324_c0_g1_i1.p1  ORF type:complete len:153 (-),score=22.41 TRINITY_DN110324_c0_g1_i1:141-599(-)